MLFGNRFISSLADDSITYLMLKFLPFEIFKNLDGFAWCLIKDILPDWECIFCFFMRSISFYNKPPKFFETNRNSAIPQRTVHFMRLRNDVMEGCMMKIEHVAMYVNDLETAKEFFVKYLNGTANDGYPNAP